MGTGIAIAQVTMQNILLIYFLIKVIAVSLTQETEVEDVSNRIEKAGLIKVLDEVKQKNLKVDQLTTDFDISRSKNTSENRKRDRSSI